EFNRLPGWMKKAHFHNLDKEWETFTRYLKSQPERRCVPFMAPDLPPTFVPRHAKHEDVIRRLLDTARERPVATNTVLQGQGGFGKTTLAAAVCHDENVQQAFDDGILWATLGQQPNIMAELTKLYEAIAREQPRFVDEQQAAIKLGEKLDSRQCLLVIDDVWHRAHLEPFMRGGKQTCARLITTRR